MDSITEVMINYTCRVHASYQRLGDALFRFSGFRILLLSICSICSICLNSPSAENMETLEPVGRLYLPRLPLAYSLYLMSIGDNFFSVL